VYIGSPHTFHYENARDALKAKKAVLCGTLSTVRFVPASSPATEKPITTNTAELRSLIQIAKDNNVFLMEGNAALNALEHVV
jgi:predicted dehydrogenase